MQTSGTYLLIMHKFTQKGVILREGDFLGENGGGLLFLKKNPDQTMSFGLVLKYQSTVPICNQAILKIFSPMICTLSYIHQYSIVIICIVGCRGVVQLEGPVFSYNWVVPPR